MSTIADTVNSRRPRRQFDDDFKTQAVRPVLDEGKSVRAVARDLDLTGTAQPLGAPGPRRSHQGPHRPNDLGARETRTAAERESDSPRGTRDLKKGGSLPAS